MNCDVLLTARAEDQMRAIADWYGERDAAAGERWFNGLVAAMESMAENPGQFPFAAENEKLSSEFREMLYGSGKRKTHRVLFVIRGPRVIVHHIRHVAQDEYSQDH